MNKATSGWMNGFLGVLIFSGSLPATRLAVADFDPLFLTVCRAAIAGVLAGALLLTFRQQRPAKSDIIPLLVVAFGVVIGFPLLTALALQYVTSAHAIVFIGLLPLATAIFGVLRGGERPRPVFWIFSAAGSLLVAGFALIQGGVSSPLGDAYMLASIVVCGLGYAEGARLSRRLGNWQVISWALVLSLPVMLPFSFYFTPDSWSGIGVPALLSLARVLVSGSRPRRYCGGWTAAASPAFLWTAACLSDSARESGLGTRSSEYRRYSVRGSRSAIRKVRQTI